MIPITKVNELRLSPQNGEPDEPHKEVEGTTQDRSEAVKKCHHMQIRKILAHLIDRVFTNEITAFDGRNTTVNKVAKSRFMVESDGFRLREIALVEILRIFGFLVSTKYLGCSQATNVLLV